MPAARNAAGRRRDRRLGEENPVTELLIGSKAHDYIRWR